MFSKLTQNNEFRNTLYEYKTSLHQTWRQQSSQTEKNELTIVIFLANFEKKWIFSSVLQRVLLWFKDIHWHCFVLNFINSWFFFRFFSANKVAEDLDTISGLELKTIFFIFSIFYCFFSLFEGHTGSKILPENVYLRQSQNLKKIKHNWRVPHWKIGQKPLWQYRSNIFKIGEKCQLEFFLRLFGRSYNKISLKLWKLKARTDTHTDTLTARRTRQGSSRANIISPEVIEYKYRGSPWECIK